MKSCIMRKFPAIWIKKVNYTHPWVHSNKMNNWHALVHISYFNLHEMTVTL